MAEGSKLEHLGCTEQDNSHSYQRSRADSHTEARDQEDSSPEGCCTAVKDKPERHTPGCRRRENHRHWEDSSSCDTPAESGSPTVSSVTDNPECDDE